jgi:ribosomal protein L3
MLYKNQKITRDKERSYIIIKGSIHKENKTIIMMKYFQRPEC